MSITASEWTVLAKWLFDSCAEEELENVNELFLKYPELRSDLAEVNESLTLYFTSEMNIDKLYQKTIIKLKTSAS